jgi:hypothetical protein
VSKLCPGSVHCPCLPILECNPVEVVEGGRYDLVPDWEAKRDSELRVDHANIDFFNLGAKVCEIDKSGSKRVVWTTE